MKKLLASLLVGGFIAFGAPAFAYAGIDDVCENYWAQVEIASVVSDSVIMDDVIIEKNAKVHYSIVARFAS